MNDLITQLDELRLLRPGWDGEGSPAPVQQAIDDAIRFVRAAGPLADQLDSEPGLHADGSIILSADAGDLHFRGDGLVVYVTSRGIGAVPADQIDPLSSLWRH